MSDPSNPLPIFPGVAVIISRDGRLLLGRRINAHGAGTWAFVGGKPEPGETFEECAVREAREEVDVLVSDLSFWGTVESDFPEIGKRYRTHFYVAGKVQGEARICEPDRCSEQGWFRPDDLPSPLFNGLQQLVNRGIDFSEFLTS